MTEEKRKEIVDCVLHRMDFSYLDEAKRSSVSRSIDRVLASWEGQEVNLKTFTLPEWARMITLELAEQHIRGGHQ